MSNKKGLYARLSGLAAGLVNGFFGAGGGLILVPMLKKSTDGREESAHATSIIIILPLCIVSTFFYSKGAGIKPSELLPFLIGGVASAPLGAFFLKKIPAGLLGRLFGGFMIFSAIRMLL